MRRGPIKSRMGRKPYSSGYKSPLREKEQRSQIPRLLPSKMGFPCFSFGYRRGDRVGIFIPRRDDGWWIYRANDVGVQESL